MADNKKAVSYGRIFWEFFKIGLFTFGGGMAMLPVIERVAVEEKHWIDQAELLDCFSLSQAIPGVIAVSSSSYVGRRLRGLPGAAVAAVGVITPSLLVISVLAMFLQSIGDEPHVAGAFRAIKASVCGLIVTSCIRLGKEALKDAFSWIVGIAAFAAVIVFDVSAVLVVLAGALAGILILLAKKKAGERRENR